MRPLRLLYSLIFLAHAASGDTVFLKNGRTLEGVIQQETDREVTVGVGLGSVVLKRGQIARIERDDARGRAQLEAHWQSHYFNQERFVPAGFGDLAAAYRQLAAAREDSDRAQQQEAALAARHRELMAEREGLQRQQVEAARVLERTDPKVDPRGYNEAVQRNNQAVARLTTLQHEAETATKEAAAAHERRRHFARSWVDFSSAWPETAWPAATNDAGRAYRTRLGEELATCRRELQQALIPFDAADQDHRIVTAVVNGGAELRLLLDTGASFVTLSRRAAERAGVVAQSVRTMSVKLADGSQVQATPVLLERLAVGEASVDRVPAVILDGDLGAGLDGLLGMTFLREFVIGLDAGGKRLMLTRPR